MYLTPTNVQLVSPSQKEDAENNLAAITWMNLMKIQLDRKYPKPNYATFI